MKETNRELLGEGIVDRTGEIYGLDGEGEVRSSYRPSGYPGVSPQILAVFAFPYVKLLAHISALVRYRGLLLGSLHVEDPGECCVPNNLSYS